MGGEGGGLFASFSSSFLLVHRITDGEMGPPPMARCSCCEELVLYVLVVLYAYRRSIPSPAGWGGRAGDEDV